MKNEDLKCDYQLIDKIDSIYSELTKNKIESPWTPLIQILGAHLKRDITNEDLKQCFIGNENDNEYPTGFFYMGNRLAHIVESTSINVRESQVTGEYTIKIIPL